MNASFFSPIVLLNLRSTVTVSFDAMVWIESSLNCSIMSIPLGSISLALSIVLSAVFLMVILSAAFVSSLLSERVFTSYSSALFSLSTAGMSTEIVLGMPFSGAITISALKSLGVYLLMSSLGIICKIASLLGSICTILYLSSRKALLAFEIITLTLFSVLSLKFFITI